MVKEVMRRKASDNVYLHKDFHGALSNGIQFIHEKYGAEAVRDYLRQFVAAYYSALKAEIKRRGLAALRDHFEKIYRLEGGVISMECSKDELRLEVEACPAVSHMRRRGYPVAALFYETTKTVNEALCVDSPFDAELISYDNANGHSIQRFYRRKQA